MHHAGIYLSSSKNCREASSRWWFFTNAAFTSLRKHSDSQKKFVSLFCIISSCPYFLENAIFLIDIFLTTFFGILSY